MLYVLLACLCWQVKQWWLLSIRSSGLYTVVAHTHARDCLWWFRRKVELRNCVWTELASFDAEVKYMECVYSVTENVRHGCWPLYCVLQSEVPMWWPRQRRPHAHPTHELNYFWMCVPYLSDGWNIWVPLPCKSWLCTWNDYYCSISAVVLISNCQLPGMFHCGTS